MFLTPSDYSEVMKFVFVVFAVLLTFAISPRSTFAQQDSTKADTVSHGPYAGYPTWKAYLTHQDTLSHEQHIVNLGWFTIGFGSESEIPYQFEDWAALLNLTYQQNNILYRFRYLDVRDYNGGGNNSESLDEYDVLVGYGSYQPFFLNGSVGVGLRHRFHYLENPYQVNYPPHITVNYLDLPLQAEFFMPLGDNFGIGLTYYATLSAEGFDHGILLGFCIGVLNENGHTPELPPNH